jgi:uncharacterized protein YuzB (UPF0349 family)
MKRRQQCIIASQATNCDTYGGEPFRLFSTAKTVAWLSNLHWLPLDDTVSFGRLHQKLVSELDNDESMLVFLTSCLSTCLDCACDLFKPQTNRMIYRDEEATSHFESI